MPRSLKLKGPLFRTFSINPVARAAAAESPADAPTTYDVTVSTEAPVIRYDWWTGREFMEVLGHGADEVDLSYMRAGPAVLEEHRGLQVGIGEGVSLDPQAGKLGAAIRFSKAEPRGVIAEGKLKEGVLRHISVGYEVRKYKLVSTDKEGMDTFRAIDWTPYEISLVGIPADLNAGVGRHKDEERELLVPIEGSEPQEDSRMKKVLDGNGRAIEVADEDPRPAYVAERAAIEMVEREVDPEIARANTILDFAKSRGVQELAADLVQRGLTVREAAAEILKQSATRGAAQPAAEALSAVPAKDARRYSLARAIRRTIEGNLDGFELEVHQQIERFMPKSQERHGMSILVPTRFELGAHETRTMGSGVAGGGAEIVFDQPGQLIEILRPNAMVIQSGATVLSGLSAPVPFPVQATDVTVYPMDENPAAAVTDSEVTFTTALLSPKTMQSTVPIPRQLIVQSSPTLDVESLVRASIMAQHDRKLDRWALHGLGTTGEPLGIWKTPGVNVEDFGAVPTWVKLIEMTSKIVEDNADIGAMRWLTTPLMAGVLMGTPRVATYGSVFMWEGNHRNGLMTGYTASSTNQISKLMLDLEATGGTEHGIAFGVWSELVIGLFGAIEVVVDPYTLATKGQIRITSFQMVDTVIKHPAAFCVSTDARLA